MGLTRVVNTSLDDVIQGVATGGLLVPQLAIYFLSQDLGHMVVVLGQFRELLVNFVVELEVVVGVSERHDCFLTLKRREKKKSRSDKLFLKMNSHNPTLQHDLFCKTAGVKLVLTKESW